MPYIVSLVLAVVLLVSTTYAWYVGRTEVEIGSDTNVSIGVDIEGLEIAIDGTSFTTNLKVSQNLNLSDISGDGMHFLYPNVLTTKDLATTSTSDYKVINLANKNEYSGYLISFKLTFRTREKMDIFLSTDSYVVPKSYNYDSANDLATPKKDKIDRRSSGGGDFSSDCIAGCARVAIVEETNDGEELRNLWVPNPYIQLNKQNAEENPNTCLTNGVMEAYSSQFSETVHYENTNPYGYVYLEDGQIKETVYSTEDYVNKKVTIGKMVKNELKESDTPTQQLATKQMANNAKKLLSFDTSATPVNKSVIVRIWFEGTDRESDRLLNGGLVDFNLKFVGLSKKEQPQELVNKLNGITNEGGKLKYGGQDLTKLSEKYQFSQNGYYWWDYVSTATVDANAYVRLAETDEYYQSSAVKL